MRSQFISYLEVVIIEPSVGVSGVIVVNHVSYVFGIVPKIAESSGYVVGLCVVLVGLISQVSGEQREEFSHIL